MKKALTETTMMIIAAVIGAAVLLTITGELYADISEDADVEQCRTSYLKAHVAKTTTGDTLRTPIDCPVQNLTIQKEEDVLEGLRDCWYKTLGNENRLGELYWLWINSAKADTSICIVCATFTPEKNIDVQDVKNKMQLASRRDSVTYQQFLSNDKWNDPNRFFLSIQKRLPRIIQMTEELLKEGTGVTPLTTLEQGTQYVILSQTKSKTSHTFITLDRQKSNAPCETPINQKAKKAI